MSKINRLDKRDKASKKLNTIPLDLYKSGVIHFAGIRRDTLGNTDNAASQYVFGVNPKIKKKDLQAISELGFDEAEIIKSTPLKYRSSNAAQFTLSKYPTGVCNLFYKKSRKLYGITCNHCIRELSVGDEFIVNHWQDPDHHYNATVNGLFSPAQLPDFSILQVNLDDLNLDDSKIFKLTKVKLATAVEDNEIEYAGRTDGEGTIQLSETNCQVGSNFYTDFFSTDLDVMDGDSGTPLHYKAGGVLGLIVAENSDFTFCNKLQYFSDQIKSETFYYLSYK